MRFIHCILFPVFLLLMTSNALAHFGMIIPSENIVTPQKKNIQLTLSFSHPFEGIGMDLARPEAVYMLRNGQRTELRDTLQPIKIMGKEAWQTMVQFKRPGVYWFVMEPVPYWEAAEDIFIQHYSKTVVAAFGDDMGWDQPLGLPTEIVPLTRPFGNYAGNSFSGKVLVKGKPAANTVVEVELYNKDLKLSAPSDYHVTQQVKTDDNGIFTFTCPQPGWWGFAALHEGDSTLKGPDGTQKNVELGAILWIYMDAYQTSDSP